ncbi:hypothetical protein [Sphingomicrobium marinum]|nr:hypothetical protein [Sphingomicrobium marinum]
MTKTPKQRRPWARPTLQKLDTKLATMGGSTRNGEGGPLKKS